MQTYVKRYSNKSLCVLNQKDRLKNAKEIETSIEYAKRAFDGFFEKVVAISAKQALDSIKMISPNIANINDLYKASITSGYDSFNKDVTKQLFNDSNIRAVLDFIYNSIQPNALYAKVY